MSRDPLANGPSSNQLLVKKDGHLIGKNPLSIDINLLKEAGHGDNPIVKIIRKKCLDCCGQQKGEVRKCVVTDCPLWAFRMGVNPFLSEKRKANKSYFGGAHKRREKDLDLKEESDCLDQPNLFDEISDKQG